MESSANSAFSLQANNVIYEDKEIIQQGYNSWYLADI